MSDIAGLARLPGEFADDVPSGVLDRHGVVRQHAGQFAAFGVAEFQSADLKVGAERRHRGRVEDLADEEIA